MRKEGAERPESPRCYILDDTTLEKTGSCIEKVSRVFDHVCGRCVLGFKLLLLAVSDGASTVPVDFSLHRERGKRKDFGLRRQEAAKQFRARRKSSDPDSLRARECDRSKMDMAIEMLQRAWKYGIRAQYLLADSWFTCERLIEATRAIGKGAVHYIGLGKMGRTKYEVRGKLRNALELISLHQREGTRQCRKYKCMYVSLKARLGSQQVRIFLIRYGRNKNWNILISSDMSLSFVKTFELYQMRWNIEVLNKECKGYLGLGGYQGRNFNGQVADCTLCFITYTVLALWKRFSTYETMGEMFRAEREQLLALTLWKRILACMEKLLAALAESLGTEPMQMIHGLLNNEEQGRQIVVLADALLKYYSENEQKAA